MINLASSAKMAASVPFNVEFAGKPFGFSLHRRQLNLGAVGAADYLWMDGRQFRRGNGGPNFRSCVDLWCAAAEDAGESDFEGNQRLLVLAECYPLVNTSRGVQDVFLDAHRHPAADREYFLVQDESGKQSRHSAPTSILSTEESERLRLVVRQRDVELIAKEFGAVLAGNRPAEAERPALNEMFAEWTDSGIEVVRNRGREGLQQFKLELDQRIRSMRRRGQSSINPMFLNMFAYECKAAFFHCYSSAWIALLNHLAEQKEANELGLRLMKLWHYQTQRIDPATDVFHSHVFALHPLSGIMFTAPEHLHAIGQWVGHPQYEYFSNNRKLHECSEYWDLVAAILIAAHEYRLAHRRWADSRGSRILLGHGDGTASGGDTAADVGRYIEAFADDNGIRCPRCSAALGYHSLGDSNPQEGVAECLLICNTCHETTTIPITARRFSDWLRDE